MTKYNLARMKKVALRQVWQHEAFNFTNWLAEEENLALLSDTIGIDINLIETETSVGSFSVDILAEDANNGRKIIIENQLESTDHDHLGKIITYASGLDAEIVIWIVKDVREEHKRAIDWLNEHTDSSIFFFAIEMEVWQIADSPYAPKFNIVAEPNDWAKAVKSSTTRDGLSETQMLQLEFWTEFNSYIENRDEGGIRPRRPRPRGSYDVSLGGCAHIALLINTKSDDIGVDLYIPDSMELFYCLESNKSRIENELETRLEWQELPDKRASRIKLSLPAVFHQKDRWSEYHEWLYDNALLFRKVFSRFIDSCR